MLGRMGSGLLKVGGLAAAAYVGSLVLAFVLTVITAATTERWGVSSAEKAVIALFVAIGGVFLLSLLLVAFGAWHWLPGWGPRIAVLVGYVILVVPTLLLGGFLLMVVFNR